MVKNGGALLVSTLPHAFAHDCSMYWYRLKVKREIIKKKSLPTIVASAETRHGYLTMLDRWFEPTGCMVLGSSLAYGSYGKRCCIARPV
jgi:hypothetical protein